LRWVVSLSPRPLSWGRLFFPTLRFFTFPPLLGGKTAQRLGWPPPKKSSSLYFLSPWFFFSFSLLLWLSIRCFSFFFFRGCFFWRGLFVGFLWFFGDFGGWFFFFFFFVVFGFFFVGLLVWVFWGVFFVGTQELLYWPCRPDLDRLSWLPLRYSSSPLSSLAFHFLFPRRTSVH